ncbi:PTS fructose/mannitol-specific subunit IIA [OP3_merged] [Candidatus Velamenicoccus archaeovorus]|uniref:PTS fructose/mannitol-specific subunit IIA [OP3_merged] n=1 Tax=Velamenicoccus archaeovorus TaxID=1930593 RepID=A0A410P2R4_VELA1|nr:PTS sugar transporter subunit IIA [Candidatus Velamenicoccus archaeovorus]QAT16382.1 PTS fructose/mannitol-specific subunit IIA [OP3_merged] [Candidatus Velamenicoccus archaeovorus]
MKIMDFLSEEAITTDLKSVNKTEAIKELVELLIVSGDVDKKDKNKVVELLLAREALGSTAIGHNVGIPHAKADCIKSLVGAFGLSRKGVDFDSLDGEPVYIFFLLLAPQDSAGPHLKALARISRLIKDKYFRDTLKAAKDKKDVIRIIETEDDKKL